MQAASLSILELRRHVLSQSLFFRLLATFRGGRPSPLSDRTCAEKQEA